jgi:SAM-dependent methyltransferase
MSNSFSQPESFAPWNQACEGWLLNQAIDLNNFIYTELEEQTQQDQEKQLADSMLNGFMSTLGLFGAIEIGIFEALALNPNTAEQLAEQLQVPFVNLNRLLYLLKRLELLTTQEQLWQLTVPARRFFTPSCPEFEPYLWTRLAMTRLFLTKYVSQWGEMIRGRRSFDEIQWPPQNSEQSIDFEYIMTAEAPYLAALLQPVLAENQAITRLLDVGGGNGTIASLLARQLPRLTIDVLNLPYITDQITATAEKFQVIDRVHALAQNFLETAFPTNYDAILFSRVLVDWPDEIVSRLLSKARQALHSQGRLLICERIGGTNKGVERFWLTFMAMGVNAHVFARQPLRWVELLDNVGFSHIQIQSEGSYEGYGVIEAIPQSLATVTQEEPLLRPSQSSYRNGDNLQIKVPPLPAGQRQYLGIKIPGGKFFLIKKLNSLVVFNNVNLIRWQDGELAIDRPILPNLPRGKYLLYRLCTLDNGEPFAPFEPWQLNVSGFRVER